MLRKKTETFSVDEIRTLFRGAFSTNHAVSDFEVLIFFDTSSCFASACLKALKCSKIGHARRMGNFTREITLNDEYLSQFLSDCMNLEQLVETFIKVHIYDSSRAICVLLRGQNHLLVPSGWGKARKISQFHKTPFRGRIESTKSGRRMPFYRWIHWGPASKFC